MKKIKNYVRNLDIEFNAKALILYTGVIAFFIGMVMLVITPFLTEMDPTGGYNSITLILVAYGSLVMGVVGIYGLSTIKFLTSLKGKVSHKKQAIKEAKKSIKSNDKSANAADKVNEALR